MRRNPSWVSHRPDVVQALNEAALQRYKQYLCGRCNEEVAKAAMWCPHCGYDMTSGGATERVGRIRQPHEPIFHQASRRLLIGTTVGALILLLCLLSTLGGFRLALGFGTIALFISVVALGSELSMRAVLYSLPTVLSCLIFLSLLKQ